MNNSHSNNASYIFVLIIGVVIGYLTGWFANESQEARLMCMVIGGVLVIGIAIAKGAINSALEGEAAIVAQRRDNLKMEAKDERDMIAILKKKVRAYKEEIQLLKDLDTTEFSSLDFTDDAINLILPSVKEAKKNGVKVTGHGLINRFLKGIK